MKKSVVITLIFSFLFTGIIMGFPVLSDAAGARSVGYWKNHDYERNAFIGGAVSLSSVFDTTSLLDYYLSKKGKKNMEERTKQQLAALLLNVASGLSEDTLLTSGELEILQMIDSTYDTSATVGDALYEIENAIVGGYYLEVAKNLADEINNRDE